MVFGASVMWWFLSSVRCELMPPARLVALLGQVLGWLSTGASSVAMFCGRLSALGGNL